MEVTLAFQFRGFVFACAAGFVLGAFFDFFRVFRVLSGCGRTAVFFQDLLSLSFAGFITFLVMLTVNAGNIRFFLLAGEAIGVCIWFLTVGEVTIRIARLICRVVGGIFWFFQTKIVLPIFHSIYHAGHRVGKFFKNFFGKKKKSLE